MSFKGLTVLVSVNRNPIVAGPAIASDPGRCSSGVTSGCDELLSFDLLKMGDVDRVVVILNPRMHVNDG